MIRTSILAKVLLPVCVLGVLLVGGTVAVLRHMQADALNDMATVSTSP